MRKFISMVVAVSTFASVSLAYDKIYDLPSEEQIITSGVTYQAINRFTTNGWVNINVLTVDLENDNVKVDLLTPRNGMYNVDNVLNQAIANDAVAAVNAEFFNKVGSNAYSIGFSMIDEKVTSSPYYGNAKGDTMADIGTGSGILAICAKKFGASSAYGCDNDETVIDVCIENAKINNEDCTFELKTADLLTEKYNFVCANILHNILAEIMGDLKNIMKPNAKMVLSGILDEKKPVVLDAIHKHGLKIVETLNQDQWVAFVVEN